MSRPVTILLAAVTAWLLLCAFVAFELYHPNQGHSGPIVTAPSR